MGTELWIKLGERIATVRAVGFINFFCLIKAILHLNDKTKNPLPSLLNDTIESSHPSLPSGNYHSESKGKPGKAERGT